MQWTGVVHSATNIHVEIFKMIWNVVHQFIHDLYISLRYDFKAVVSNFHINFRSHSFQQLRSFLRFYKAFDKISPVFKTLRLLNSMKVLFSLQLSQTSLLNVIICLSIESNIENTRCSGGAPICTFSFHKIELFLPILSGIWNIGKYILM